MPKITDDTNICWIFWRAGSWANYDGGEMLEMRTKLLDGQVIVFNNMDLAIRNRSAA
jgi:hypothetical protein